MTASEKTKTINNKTEQNKAHYNWTDKLPRVQLNHQEMLVK